MALVATDTSGNESEISWAEIYPREHLVQIYQEEGAFADSLEAFVAGGLRAGESVIVIATSEHLCELESRLLKHSIDLIAADLSEQFIALEASAVLAKFMVNGWPDDVLFEQVVMGLLKRAGKGGRRVRAFGEMVAMMWARGQTAAAVHLERLWHKLCHKRGFSLFCAYPRNGFTENADASIREICAAHSKYILG